jgi:hypothetical protein
MSRYSYVKALCRTNRPPTSSVNPKTRIFPEDPVPPVPTQSITLALLG